MDKDLRDAYKALTLMRADLTATKKEKEALEQKWNAFVEQQRSKVAQLRESFRLREEKLLQQLEATTKQETAKHAHEEGNQADSSSHSLSGQPETEGPGEDDNQADDTVNPMAAEIILRDNLSLQAQLQAQAEQLIAQEAVFVQSRDEWALRHDALTMQLASMDEQLSDVNRDKKFMEEKFEFLHAEVDVVKTERDELRQRVQELEAERERDGHEVEIQRLVRELEQAKLHTLASQTEVHSEWEQERAAWGSERSILECKIAAIEQDRGQNAATIDNLRHEVSSLTQKITNLECERDAIAQQLKESQEEVLSQQQQHAREEEERTTLQLSEREAMKGELTTLLANFEAMVAENAVKMGSLQHANEALQSSLKAKIGEWKTVKERLHRSELRCVTLEEVVALQRTHLRECQQKLHEQRDAIVRNQAEQTHELQAVQVAVQKLRTVDNDRQQLEDTIKQLTAENTEIQRVWSECQAQLVIARELLKDATDASDRELVSARLEMEERLANQRTEHENQLASAQVRLDSVVHTTAIEKESLLQELQGLQSTVDDLRRQLSDTQPLSVQLPLLEDQLMAANDHHRPASTPTLSTWDQLSSTVRHLDDFLPQLQLFVGRLHSSLQLCADNTRAIKLLASPSLLHQLDRLLGLVQRWQADFEAQQLAVHMRAARRSVLDSLSQWFEESELETDAEPTPPPPFAIDSKEVAIVLQNWTADQDKQQQVALWLQRVATRQDITTTEDAAEDPAPTMTLELANMTRHVKDAFCVLVVPILQQNHRAHVRVFTRRVADAKSSYSPDESCWEMKIYVQFSTASRPATRRRLSSLHSSSSISSVDSVASSLSLASTSSVSKLQIIHARLQQMQQQNNST